MVDVMDHQVLHNPVDLLQIDHHARLRVHRSANSHLKFVVVAVVPGTRPEYLAIAGFVPLWLGKDVTGRKGQPSGHFDARWLVHAYMRKSILRWITSKPLPPLRLAGRATASMMWLGCQRTTWLRSPPVNAKRPPAAT